MLVDLKQRVLSTCHRNAGLDSILILMCKLFPEYKSKITRISPSKYQIHEGVRDLFNDKKQFKSIDEYNKNLDRKQILATICTQASSNLLSKPKNSELSVENVDLDQIKFDVCIVNEASQIVEPLLLSALLNARKFILIGDYCQFRPTVKSKSGKKGLSVSLFEKLCNKRPEAISFLTYQVNFLYFCTMNSHSNEVSNE